MSAKKGLIILKMVVNFLKNIFLLSTKTKYRKTKTGRNTVF